MEDDSSFSLENRKRIYQIADGIVINDFNGILRYGGGTPRKVSRLTENLLSSIVSNKAEELGSHLTEKINELRELFQIKKGFFGFFQPFGDKVLIHRRMVKKRRLIKKQTANIVYLLDSYTMQVLTDKALLTQLMEKNKLYADDLSIHIIAGKMKLEQVKQDEIPEHLIQVFEKKINDLAMTKQITLQMIEIIRMTNENNAVLVQSVKKTKDKIESFQEVNQALLDVLDEVVSVRKSINKKQAEAKDELERLKNELDIMKESTL